MKIFISGSIFDKVDELFPGFGEIILGDGDLDDAKLQEIVDSRHEKPVEWVDALQDALDMLADLIHMMVDDGNFEAAQQLCKVAGRVKKDLRTMRRIVPINELEA